MQVSKFGIPELKKINGNSNYMNAEIGDKFCNFGQQLYPSLILLRSLNIEFEEGDREDNNIGATMVTFEKATFHPTGP